MLEHLRYFQTVARCGSLSAAARVLCVSQPGLRNGPGGSWSTDGLAAGSGDTAEPVARFRFDAVEDTWWWSPAMYALHGFSPGEVVILIVSVAGALAGIAALAAGWISI